MAEYNSKDTTDTNDISAGMLQQGQANGTMPQAQANTAQQTIAAAQANGTMPTPGSMPQTGAMPQTGSAPTPGTMPMPNEPQPDETQQDGTPELNDDVTKSTDEQAEQVSEAKQQQYHNLNQASSAFGQMFADAVSNPEVEHKVSTNPILDSTATTPSPVPDVETLVQSADNEPDNQAVPPVQNPQPYNNMPAYNSNNMNPDMMNAEIAQINSMINDLDGNQQDMNAPEEPEKTAEELLNDYINSDEFYDKFAENPGQAIIEVANRISSDREGHLTERLKPLLDQADQIRAKNQTVDAINRFVQMGNGAYDDFGDHIDGITNIIRSEGLDINDPLSYENAYGRVKASDLQRKLDEANAQRGRTLDDYFSDDDAMERMANNDGVKSRVITAYLKGLDEGASPQVINNSSGSEAPAATPANKISNFRDAREAFEKQFSGR